MGNELRVLRNKKTAILTPLSGDSSCSLQKDMPIYLLCHHVNTIRSCFPNFLKNLFVIVTNLQFYSDLDEIL